MGEEGRGLAAAAARLPDQADGAPPNRVRNQETMAQRIFIKVVGFTDEERHALNTVFRLSEQCLTMYQLWTPEAPEPARVALLDAGSGEAWLEAESPLQSDMQRFWIGANPPATILRSFERPIPWTEVVECLDALFNTLPDLDLPLLPAQAMLDKQALIVSADRERRLYLRARLALAKLTLADDAPSGAQALELARERQYDLALVDCGLQDVDAWALLRALRQGRHPIRHVAMTRSGLSLAERARAWLSGAEALVEHPAQLGRLDAWLARI
jgi:CheY-like chemotaxis protein